MASVRFRFVRAAAFALVFCSAEQIFKARKYFKDAKIVME